jgi:hypothetical protein
VRTPPRPARRPRKPAEPNLVDQHPFERPARGSTYNRYDFEEEWREVNRSIDGLGILGSEEGEALKSDAVELLMRKLNRNSRREWQGFVKELRDLTVTGDPRREYGWLTTSPYYAPGQHEASLISNLIGNWAGTSADKQALAIALQQAAIKEFKLKGVAQWWGKEAGQLAKQSWGSNRKLERGLRAFLRAMYDATQDQLRAAGVEHVWAFRGIKFKSAKKGLTWTRKSKRLYGQGRGERRVALTEGQRTTVKQQPLSSWANDAQVGEMFASGLTGESGANYRAVMATKIPRERIMGMPGSGFGCSEEHELIVLGGGSDEVVATTWWAETRSIGAVSSPEMSTILEDIAEALKETVS